MTYAECIMLRYSRQKVFVEYKELILEADFSSVPFKEKIQLIVPNVEFIDLPAKVVQSSPKCVIEIDYVDIKLHKIECSKDCSPLILETLKEEFKNYLCIKN